MSDEPVIDVPWPSEAILKAIGAALQAPRELVIAVLDDLLERGLTVVPIEALLDKDDPRRRIYTDPKASS